jgi:hypothetical protein
MHAGEINTWDYAWTYACWVQHGLAVYPNVNLVSNIGFRSDATHTTGAGRRANVHAADIGALRHPAVVVRRLDADRYTAERVFGTPGGRRERLTGAIKGTMARLRPLARRRAA